MSCLRRVLVVGVLLAVVLGTTRPGSLSAQSPAEVNPVPDLTGARAVVAANPLRWQPCAEIFECATLTVPLDYSGRVAGTTTLAVTRLPARDPARRIGSLVVNYGGPGAPAVETMHEIGERVHPRALLERFDLVGIDPRGIGQSTPLNCRLRASGLDPDALIALDPDDDAEWQEMLAIAQGVAEACARNGGPIVPFMGTHEFTIDLEMLRLALAEETLNLLMFSYGTQVGALFAQRFPGSIRALVLDSAVNLNIDGIEQEEQQARGREEVFNYFLEQCSLSPACPFHEGGNPAAAWDELLAEIRELDEDPAVGEVVIGFLRNLSGLSARQRRWGELGYILAAFKSGDEAALRRILGEVEEMDEEEPEIADIAEEPQEDPDDENGDGMWFTAVECLDWEWSRSPEEWRRYAIRLRTRTAPRSLSGVAWHLPCLYWQTPPSLHAAPTIGRGAPPIMVIGNTYDQATPYHWSVAVAGQLESARLVTRIGVGHIASEKSACIDFLVQNYLFFVTPPAAGATCPSDPVEGIWSVPPALRGEAPPPDQERRSTHAPIRYPGAPRPGETPPPEPERRR